MENELFPYDLNTDKDLQGIVSAMIDGGLNLSKLAITNFLVQE